MRRLLLIPCLAFTACLSGLGEGDPTPIRYFTAELPAGEKGALAADAPELRLRRVTAAAHLRERMVWRASDVEFGFYETRRWTEPPVVWLEAALARELFDRHGVAGTERASALALDVHLAGFEEVLSPHGVRVAVDLRLGRSGGEQVLETRVERTAPVERDDPAAVAAAMKLALAEVVAAGASEVAAAAAR